MSFVKVLFQIVDFAVKAMVAYSQTPAGQKEWNDIEVAAEVAANNDDDKGVEYAATAPGEKPVRVIRNG